MTAHALATDRPPLHTYVSRAERRFLIGGMHLTVALYGSQHGDWSSRHLALPPDLSKEYRTRLGKVLEEQYAGEVYALIMPKEFNARIVGREHFRQDNLWAGTHELYRNAKCAGEGLLLKPGEAALITPSNCATAVLTLDEQCAVVHFGRWSLFDQHLVWHEHPDPDRAHESVMYAALEALGVKTEQDAARVTATLFWGAHPNDYRHPIVGSPFAKKNEKLRAYMRQDLSLDASIQEDRYFRLDLQRVAALQLRKRGVPYKNIDTQCGHLPQSGVWRDGAAGMARNAVLVIRRS